MDAPEFLTVVYDMEEGQYSHYSSPVEPLDATNNMEMLEPNLRVASNLFEAKPDDLLSIKVEHENVQATEDESMAVEALRQLGNSTYANSPCIETTTHQDLPALPCPTCEMEFRTTADLNSHSEICKLSQFICPICKAVYERKFDLNNHLVCHAVDRPHSCRLCSTLFIHKHDLQQHMLTHGTNTLNQCQVCGQSFNRPSSLTNHMKIHNYQPGRALMNTKIEGNTELAEILTGNDPQMQPVQKVILPSINNIANMNNWNLCYEPENFNSDINLEIAEDVTINTSLENKIVKVEAEEINKKKPYSCSKCPKVFAREKALISHLKLHKDVLDNYYTCERCDQTFNNGTALDKHLQYCGVKTKQPEAPKEDPVIEKCNPPPVEFLNNSNFDVNVYNKIYKHGCTECGKNFTTKQKLYRHMWIHRKKVYSCELCTKTFEKQELLDTHRLSTHQSGSPYVCAECGKNFSSRQGLWEHNRIHTTETNSFKCTTCSKTFSSRQGYLIHKRLHTNERPYGCRFCWKAFRDGGTLRKHERIHTGERPHACPVCSKAFNQKVVLREHVRWLHTATLTANTEGLYDCAICSVQVPDKDELCAHLVRHSDQMAQLAKDASRNNIMPKAKVRRTVLKVEEASTSMDLDDPPEQGDEIVPQEVILVDNDIMCDLCGDVFSNKNDLSDHVRVHI